MSKYPLSRRQFIHLGSGALAATTVAKNILQPHLVSANPRPVAPSDTIRFASIGTGIRGCEHLQASMGAKRIVKMCASANTGADGGEANRVTGGHGTRV